MARIQDAFEMAHDQVVILVALLHVLEPAAESQRDVRVRLVIWLPFH